MVRMHCPNRESRPSRASKTALVRVRRLAEYVQFTSSSELVAPSPARRVSLTRAYKYLLVPSTPRAVHRHLEWARLRRSLRLPARHGFVWKGQNRMPAIQSRTKIVRLRTRPSCFQPDTSVRTRRRRARIGCNGCSLMPGLAEGCFT